MSDNDINDDVGFVCSCEESVRSACVGLPLFRAITPETPYCVLHFPGEKSAEFTRAIKTKLELGDFDFAGVYFPESISFFGRRFPSDVSFERATFASNVDFGECIFDGEAKFVSSIFKGDATFLTAEMKGPADFTAAEFHQRAMFNAARFFDYTVFTFAVFKGETDFERACFKSFAMFDFVAVKDALTFGSKRDYNRQQGFIGLSILSMNGARIDHPENVLFQTLSLRPRWFINVDVREFNFMEVTWKGLSPRGYSYKLMRDVAALKKNKTEMPHSVLAKTYRQLAINAEENHRYRQASIFRYWSMDVPRLENLSSRSLLTLDWWYWAASGYGERAVRAFIMLLVLIVLFGFSYLFVGFSGGPDKRLDTTTSTPVDTTGAPIKSLPAALLYSSEVLTLQKPEPKPFTTMARTLVMLEALFGPTQLALLVLAIRRRFMR